jgi:PAS domain S-box-containing protein
MEQHDARQLAEELRRTQEQLRLTVARAAQLGAEQQATIAALEQTNAVLHADAERLRLAIAGWQFGTWSFDLRRGQGEGSARTWEIFGLDPAQPMTIAAWTERIHPDDRERAQAAWAAALQTGSFALDYRITRPDGELRWVSVRGQLCYDAAGQPQTLDGLVADVTERKRDEAAQAVLETNQRAILDSANQSIMLLAPDYTLQLFNRYAAQATAAFFGRTMQQGQSILEYVAPDDRASFLAHFQQAMQGHEVYVEKAIASPHGVSWWEFFFCPIVKPDGTVTGVTLTTRAIGQRKQAEAALRRAAEVDAFRVTLHDAVRALADPIHIQEAATQTAMQYFEADRCYYCEIKDGNAIIARDAFRADLPSVAGVYPLSSFPILQAVVEASRPFVVHDVHTTDMVDEELRQLCIRLQVISFVDVPIIKNGVPVGILCLVQSTPRGWTDLEVELAAETAERIWAAMERARAEAALRESEQRLRVLIENLPGGAAFIVDRNLRYLLAAGEALAPAGLKAADLTGKTLAEALPPELVAQYESIYRQALAGQTFEFEHSAHGRSFISRGTPLHSANGDVYAVLAVSYDITERKQVEAALCESVERLRIALEAAEMGTWEWNLQTNEVRCNERHFLLFGMPPNAEPLSANAFLHRVHPDDRSLVRERLAQAIRDNTIYDVEFRIVRDDGLLRWMNGYGQTVQIVAGQATRVSGVMLDITERKQAEDTLQRANEELEARVAERTAELTRSSAVRQELLHQLMGAQEEERRRIARELHDSLGQFLAALNLRLTLLLERDGAEPAVMEELQRLHRLVAQVDGELDRLTMELRPPALDDMGLPDALHRYTQEWTRTTQVAVDVLATGFDRSRLPPATEATAYRIVQEALTNVLKHAQASQVSVLLERRPHELRVIVEDDGVGFDADALVDQGHGGRHLGLVGMGERAQLVGGQVLVESVPGQGTTLFLRVPLADTHTKGTNHR